MKELLRPNSSVGYCHVEQGCKIAIGGLFNPNGIAMASNGTIYLSSSLSPGIRVLNRQDNDELTLSDIILTGELRIMSLVPPRLTEEKIPVVIT